ncbi:MAG: hypothetical protein ACXV5Q_14865, partial [Frankiaceae bacterium]
MNRRGAAAVTALLIVVGLLLAACSSGEGHPGVRGGRAAPSASSSPATTGTAAPLQSASAPHPLGAKWDWARVGQFSPYLRATGGGQTFYELVWCDVEQTQGTRDWSRVDRVAQQSINLGYQLALKIRVGTCWATGGRGEFVRGAKGKTESAMPQDMDLYTAFVRAAVQRYSAKGVHAYAVENEVNSPSMWAGSPEDLVRLVTAAATAIRGADPKASVVDPGISSTAYGIGIVSWLLGQGRDDEAVEAYRRYYVRRFPVRRSELPAVSDVGQLREVLKSDQARRNLAYLAAARDLALRRVVDVRQLHFYEPWNNVPLLLEYLRTQLPAGMPIEAWEVGLFWADGAPGDEARADEVVKVTTGLLAGGVRQVTWLPLAFDPTGRHSDEPRYGLLDPDGSVRASGQAFRSLAEISGGATVRGVHSAKLVGAAFGRAGGTTFVVWSSNGSTVPVSVSPASAGPAGTVLQPVRSGYVEVGTRATVIEV